MAADREFRPLRTLEARLLPDELREIGDRLLHVVDVVHRPIRVFHSLPPIRLWKRIMSLGGLCRQFQPTIASTVFATARLRLPVVLPETGGEPGFRRSSCSPAG